MRRHCGTVWGALALGLLLTTAGCGRRAAPPIPPAPEPAPPGPAVPAPPPPARPGYDGASGYAPDLDTAPLRERRIVLDPGHGGRWAGALGPSGLREADVNLRVAHELSRLLGQAGARVWLTREGDYDRTVPGDSSLVADLRLRALVADSLAAEAFLSLHHNADAGGRSDVNETQTYYRRGDDGPSLDLAQSLHRRLVQTLRIGTSRLLAGNYSVLRNTRADAACLLEPSYLTFPPTESLLRDTTAIRLEAETYFMGLLDYFSAGVPQVLETGWATDWSGEAAWRPIVAKLSDEPIALDWFVDGVRIEEDGLTRRAAADGSPELAFAPMAPWRDGRHVVSVRLRGRGGNHSPVRAETLEVELAPSRLRLRAEPEAPAEGPVALTLTALDAWDRPLADTLSAADVSWTPETHFPSGALDGSVRREPGQSRFYLPRGKARPARLVARWQGLHSNPIELPLPRPGGARSGFARLAGRGGGVAGAIVLDRASGASTTADSAGFFTLPGSGGAGRSELEASAAGYTFLGRDSVGDPLLAPRWDGALLGRRIAIDAIGGGDDTEAKAPGGSVGSPINLRVARLLREYLEQAGARVELLRASETALTDAERVERAERFVAERVVRIGRRSTGPSAFGYFPGSTGGERVARILHRRLTAIEASYAEAAGGEPLPQAIRWEDASWVLQQTSCPAVSVRFGDFTREADERRFQEPAWQMREAYGIAAALAEDFRTEDGDPPSPSLAGLDLSLTRDGAPAKGLLAHLDGTALLTDGRGRVRYEGLDPALPHRIEVRWLAGGAPASAWIDLRNASSWSWDSAEASPSPVSARR